MSHSLSRCFLACNEEKLPLDLSMPIKAGHEVQFTQFYRAGYDPGGRLQSCQKLVDGNVEMEHKYEYYVTGQMWRAKICQQGKNTKIITFGPDGSPTWVSEIIKWKGKPQGAEK